MCVRSCGPQEYNHGDVVTSVDWICTSCSIPWLYSQTHMNKHTLFNDVLYLQVSLIYK